MSSKPNSTQASSQGKQATLFGFFQKAPPKPASSGSGSGNARPSSFVNGAGSDLKAAASSSAMPNKHQKDKKDAQLPPHPSSSSASAMGTIDLSSADEDEDMGLGSSAGESKGKGKNVQNGSSTAKTERMTPDTPLTSENDKSGASGNESSAASEMDTSGLDEDDDEEDISSRTRKTRTRKRAIIRDSDDEDEDAAETSPHDGNTSDSAPPPRKMAKKASGAGTKQKKADSPGFMLSSEASEDDDEGDKENEALGKKGGRGGRKKTDDDEDDFGDEDVDWDEVGQLTDAAGDSKSRLQNYTSGAKSKAASSAGKQSIIAKQKPAKSSASNQFSTKADKARQQRVDDYQNEGECFDFLLEENIRDASKKRPSDPEYDPKSLYIPPRAYDMFSAFEKQFWDIKRNYMDTVLFFQKGKFFELYERDADIAHQIFDLKLTGRVKMRMAGVPEASIDFWIAKFLGQGYKVGRVDQAETAMGADIRRKDDKENAGKGKGKPAAKSGKSIVNRELRTILTTGTIVEGSLLRDDLSNHCIAIKEYIDDAASNPRYGIVIADCSTAEFTISAFEDDVCRTRLETTIRQHRPRELVCERGNLSVPTMRLLRACVGLECSWNTLKPGSEFLSAEKAIRGLEELFYKAQMGPDANDMDLDGVDMSVAVPKQITALYGNQEAMSAMGGMLWYLQGLNLDRDLFTVKNFNIFDPIKDGQSLILDGQTLAHIEILQNSTGTDEGTLFKLLCRCSTPFGKRLFKIWLCQPLREAKAINDRLDAIEDFLAKKEFGNHFERATKSMPDLERLLSRVHAKTIKTPDFLKVLDSFETLNKMFAILADLSESFKSPTVPAVLRNAPDMEESIKNVRAMFVVDEGGDLSPGEAVESEFHRMADSVAEIEQSLQEELEEYRTTLKLRDAKFVDRGTKEIYQIEVKADAKVPSNWTKMSNTKFVNRYWSPKVERLVKELKEAKERKEMASKEYRLEVFEEFDKDYSSWLKAVKITAELDCLLSLAKSSDAIGEPAVRPEIVESDRAIIEFEELRHPCVFSSSFDFIPNDVQLGGEKQNMILLTGPNMAGKSTLLRMSCVGVIMAQLGCFVPAKSARISPCDRIVSRMGANDNMLAGQSTFRVEMEDCRKILTESTPKTLVILDELGRGTSTFDGLSIAYAVLHQLAVHLGCIGFFATHFTSLVDDFANHPEISLKHMQTHVDDDTREVTFLYKLTDGSSPKSYGPHVASMAGVPRDIVERAISVSQKFEDRTKAHEASKKKDQALHLDLQADAAYLLKLTGRENQYDGLLTSVLSIIRKKVALAKTSANQAKIVAMEEE